MKFPFLLCDLTHVLDESTPTWDGGCGFETDVNLDYKQCTSDVKFRVQHFKMHAGIGTHIDAPAHCFPGAITIDNIPLSHLVAPCVVLDLSSRAHARYALTIKDIEEFEAVHGAIQQNSFVVIKTGWERFWVDSERYRNNYIFPSCSYEAACMLLERSVRGIGIDTLSPDRPEDGFLVHKTFLGAGKYIVENIAHLDRLPVLGSFIMIMPMNIARATEAPARLVGMIPV